MVNEPIFPIQDKATQAEIKRIYDLTSFPTGTILRYIGNRPPVGWIKVENQYVDRGTYINLWRVYKESGTLVEGPNDTFLVSLSSFSGGGGGEEPLSVITGSYTPEWNKENGAATDIGNGVLRGKWSRFGNLVHAYIFLKFGSTTSETGASSVWTFTLPFPQAYEFEDVNINLLYNTFQGTSIALDQSTNIVYLGMVLNSFINRGEINLRPTANPSVPISRTFPFSWAVNDTLEIRCHYFADVSSALTEIEPITTTPGYIIRV